MGLDIIAITCSMRDGQDWQLNMLEHRCCGMIDVEVIEKGEKLLEGDLGEHHISTWRGCSWGNV